MCLITFQSTRQSAAPLSASHHPENYSFILEQLELPMFPCTAIFFVSFSLFFSTTSLCSGFFSPVFLRPSRSFSRPHQSRLQPYFFPPQLPFHRLHAQFCAPARLFRSIRLLSSRVLSIRHPEAAITAARKLNTTAKGTRGRGMCSFMRKFNARAKRREEKRNGQRPNGINSTRDQNTVAINKSL